MATTPNLAYHWFCRLGLDGVNIATRFFTDRLQRGLRLRDSRAVNLTLPHPPSRANPARLSMGVAAVRQSFRPSSTGSRNRVPPRSSVDETGRSHFASRRAARRKHRSGGSGSEACFTLAMECVLSKPPPFLPEATSLGAFSAQAGRRFPGPGMSG
jgi:hypothetical protein